MNGTVINDLHYKSYFKILSELQSTIGKYNLKEFSNITVKLKKMV